MTQQFGKAPSRLREAQITDRGVPGDSTGDVPIASILQEGASVTEVRFQLSSTAIEFNVNIGGSDVFSSTQSATAADTWASATPDQNTNLSGSNQYDVDVSITSSGAASTDMDVVVEYEIDA